MSGKMPVVVAPHPMLSAIAEKVIDPSSHDIEALVLGMAKTMYATNGCGIAAPQVGISQRLIVVDCEWDGDESQQNPLALVNPVIEEMNSAENKDWEGCLSVPGVRVLLPRKTEICVSYSDLSGNRQEMEASGLLARCIQHEIDHLDGITMLERLRGIRKIKALSIYQAALKQGAVPGSEPLYDIR